MSALCHNRTSGEFTRADDPRNRGQFDDVPDQMRRPWEPIAPAGIMSFDIIRDGLWRAC
jgi:hypothetical protein